MFTKLFMTLSTENKSEWWQLYQNNQFPNTSKWFDYYQLTSKLKSNSNNFKWKSSRSKNISTKLRQISKKSSSYTQQTNEKWHFSRPLLYYTHNINKFCKFFMKFTFGHLSVEIKKIGPQFVFTNYLSWLHWKWSNLQSIAK